MAEMMTFLAVGDTRNTACGQGDVQLVVCVREFSATDAQESQKPQSSARVPFLLIIIIII